MIAILNCFGKKTYIDGVANASVNDDGFFCELYDRGRNAEVLDQLKKAGLKGSTVGAILHIGVSGFTITPEEKKEK